MLPCSANDTVGWHTAVCRLLFHGLSSFSCPANSSACLASPAVPLVPSVPCCPTCPIVPFSLGRDSGTAGTAAFLSSLLRWIIRLTVDLPQLTCEAISRTDFPDWDSCRIRQSLCPDSLSPGFFRCPFRLNSPEHELQEGIRFLNLIDNHIVGIIRECPVTDLKLLHIAESPVQCAFPDDKHAVKEIVEPFASGKVVGRDGTVQ